MENSRLRRISPKPTREAQRRDHSLLLTPVAHEEACATSHYQPVVLILSYFTHRGRIVLEVSFLHQNYEEKSSTEEEESCLSTSPRPIEPIEYSSLLHGRVSLF